MKLKLKYFLVGVFSLLLIILIFTSSNFEHEILENKKVNKNVNNANNMLSLMLETGYQTGEYEVSANNAWPGSGYTFNTTLSKCENGGTLIWNEEKGTVSLKNNTSDRCYVYFNAPKLPDVYVAVNNIPDSVGTLANISCTGSNSTYNQMYNRIEVSSINKNTNCTLNYTERTSKTYLNQKIIGLVGTTQGTGQVVNENGYRYEGKDPNNYVWFNNELWRIIGVFDSTSHGQTDQNLVKIIRVNSIGGLTWDKSRSNKWNASSLNKLLNPIDGDNNSGAYYNAKNGNGGEYCYAYIEKVGANCNYTKIGIQDNYRSMIKEVTWYLGGYSSSTATVEKVYGNERSISYSGYIGYIGLMYASDYGYSVLSSSCARTTEVGSYNTAKCAGQSWLYGEGYEWTLTRSSNSSGVCMVDYDGDMSLNMYSNRGFAVRPSLYLYANVYVIDGNGSIDNPYIIGM